MREYPPIHPGEILQEEFLEPMGISQYRLAQDIGVPAMRISKIVNEASAPTRRCGWRAILACRLSFGPAFRPTTKSRRLKCPWVNAWKKK